MNKSRNSKRFGAFSRRSFFGRAAAAGGAMLLGSSVPGKLWAQERTRERREGAEELGSSAPGKLWAQDEGLCGPCDLPEPIPHINIPPPGGAHFYFPAAVISGPHDPSVIFNFKGFVGLGDFTLTGTGTDLETGATGAYTFHTDMRFMHGVFVGTDQVERHGSFVFV